MTLTVIDALDGADASALGAGWTKHASFSGGAAEIRSNRARLGTGESVYYHSTPITRGPIPVIVEVPVRRVSGSTSGMYGGVCLVDPGSKTLYEIDVQGTGVYLGKYGLGTYSPVGSGYAFTVAADTTYVVRVEMTSTRVKVYIDGTLRIDEADSSISPTRFGLYGGGNTSGAGYHQESISADLGGLNPDTWGWSDSNTYTRRVLNPDSWGWSDAADQPPDGTVTVYESGTHSGVVCGNDIYGRYTLVASHSPVTKAATTAKAEQSDDGGSTWFAARGVTVTSLGSNNWKLVIARPQLDDGRRNRTWNTDSAKFRVTMLRGSAPGPSAVTPSVVPAYNRNEVIRTQAGLAHTYMAAQAGGYVPADATHINTPSEWMLTPVEAFFEAFYGGWSSPSPATLLSDAWNQWNYIKTLDDWSSGKFIRVDAVSPYQINADTIHRNTLHALWCERLLRRTGDSGAISLADDMHTQCVSWAKTIIDNLYPVRRTISTTVAWSGISDTPAAVRSAVHAVGDLRRPATPNGRSYRVKQVTGDAKTGASEPTWSTSDGGEFWDGNVLWKETTRTHTGFYNTYSVGGPPYYGNEDNIWIPNKEMIIAACYLMLLTDSAAPDFFNAGSYRTAALDIVTDTIDAVCSSQQNYQGRIPYAAASYDTTYDTLYGAFCVSLAAALKYFGSTDWQLPSFISKALDWMDAYLLGEGYGVYRHGALGNLLSPGGEVLLASSGYAIEGRGFPARETIFQACFNDPATGKWTYYSELGGGSTDADLFMEDIFDGMAFQRSVIGVIQESQTDSFGWSDSPQRSISRPRSVSDSWGWSDSPQEFRAVLRPVGDLIGWSDTASGSSSWTRSPVQDSLGWNDSSSGARSTATSAADSFGWSDSTAWGRSIGRSLADSFGWSDSPTRTDVEGRIVADSWGWSDVASNQIKTRSASDLWGWSDSPTRQNVLIHVAADTWGWSDSSRGRIFGPRLNFSARLPAPTVR